MDCDHELADNMCPPLDSFVNGFCWAIIGASGTGKTNYLCSLIQKGQDRKTKLRKGFKNIFNQIFIVSPSLKTIKNNPFDDISDDWKHSELTLETLEAFEELCLSSIDESEQNDEAKPFHCLILDDCGTIIRKNKEIEHKLNRIIANRRHNLSCSIIMLLQSTKQIPPSFRSNLTHLTAFHPKTLAEKESMYEWIDSKKQDAHLLFDFAFKKPHDTFFIDLTGRSGKYKYYRNFNELNIK
jgi:DNA replication protein DnaC